MQLVLRVSTVDIERRIRFGETELLRTFQCRFECPTFFDHARQNEVGCAVDDSVDPVEAQLLTTMIRAARV